VKKLKTFWKKLKKKMVKKVYLFGIDNEKKDALELL